MSSNNAIKQFKSRFNFRKYIVNNHEYRFVGKRLFIYCPFHGENSPSCIINPTTYRCFGCGENGDSIDFLVKVHDYSIHDIITSDDFADYLLDGGEENVINNSVKNKVSSLNQRTVDQYHHQLIGRKDKHKYLHDRGIDSTTIDCANLGWGKPAGFAHYYAARYTIPVYDENNNLITMRYRIDPEFSSYPEPKYIGHPNTESYLYNSAIIHTVSDIVIVGSELDAAFLYHRYGIPAIAPPGENIFKDNWAKMLSGKNVLLWLDSDVAGKTAMLNAYKKISRYASRTKIYKWQLGLPKGYDVCDYIKDNGIDKFVSELIEYQME